MYRYIVLLLFYLLISLIPLYIPIAQNFEYEYLLISSVLTFILIPIAGLITPTRQIPTINNQYTPYIKLELVYTLIIGPLIYSLPAIFIFSFNISPCSSSGFVFWFVIQLYPAWILSHGLYHIILNLKTKQISWYLISIWLCVLYLLLFIITVYTLWFNPQKRIVSLILGFLHGPIYDELIIVDWGIILVRIEHFLIGIFILAIAWTKKFKLKQLLLFSLILITITCFHLLIFNKFVSIHNDKKTLDMLLPNSIQGNGFVLHYFKDRLTNNKKTKITMLFNEINFHIKELKEIFGQDAAPNVDIYVYPDTFSKKLWFGGEKTDITDVVTPSIHITLDTFPHPTIRHELVHALSSKFAFKGLGFHPNMAFTEGLAVALAPQEYTIPLDQGAAYILKHKKITNYSKLFSIFFWQEDAVKSYTIAGSIIDFLIANYGIESVKKIYMGLSWNQVFNEPISTIIRKWKLFIAQNYQEQKYKFLLDRLYNNPGVFLDKCPHSKIDLKISPKYGYIFRLRQPISWSYTKDYWRWKLSLSKQNKTDVTTYIQHELKKILTQSTTLPTQRLEIWVKTLQNLRNNPPTDISDIILALMESDLLKIINKHENSLQILKELNEYSKQHYLDSTLQRQIKARIYIDQKLTPNDARIWRTYLAGWSSKIPTISINKKKEPWIIIYLRLKNKDKNIYNKNFLYYLLKLKPPTNVDSIFYKEWYKSLGHLLMLLEEYSQAEIAYTNALQYVDKANIQIFKEYIRKAKFLAEQQHNYQTIN